MKNAMWFRRSGALVLAGFFAFATAACGGASKASSGYATTVQVKNFPDSAQGRSGDLANPSGRAPGHVRFVIGMSTMEADLHDGTVREVLASTYPGLRRDRNLVLWDLK